MDRVRAKARIVPMHSIEDPDILFIKFIGKIGEKFWSIDG